MRRLGVFMLVLAIGLVAGVACGDDEAAAPTIVEKEVIKEVEVPVVVEKEVIKEVPVEKVVVKEVIKEVEVAPTAKPVTYVANTIQGGTSFITEAFQQFANEVKKRTNGQLNIEVHFGGELGYKAADGYAIVEKRTVDLGEIISGFEQSTFPEFGLFTLPYFFNGFDDWAFFERLFRPRFNEISASRNSKCLYTYTLTLQHYFNKKAINSKADLKGVKMRTYNKETTDMLTALGAAPLRIDFAEVYTSLQRGTIDGMVTSASSTVDLRAWEVLSHVNLTKFAPGGLNCININLDAWNELPDSTKLVMVEVGEEIEDELRILVPSLENGLLKTLEDNGMTINEVPQATLDEFRRATQFVRDEFFTKAANIAPLINRYETVRGLK